jgi:cytochrome c553
MRLLVGTVLPIWLLGGAALCADPREVALGHALATGDLLPADHRCARCHGEAGGGDPSKEAPRIAGQPQLYLEKQLEDFASGTRRSDKMEPVARSLNEEQRAAAAAYFASLPPPPYEPPLDPDPMLLQKGGVLSAIGDKGRRIRACELCHADEGAGIAPSFPYLAGQEAAYTERQLRAWKDGARRNDPLEVMAEIARRLEDEEIRALGLYFASARPPAPTLSSPIPAEPIPPPPEPTPPPR